MEQELPPDLNPADPQLLREQDRGRQAVELLAHPLVQESLALLRQEFQAAWLDSPARDTEGRERLWHLVKLVDRFEQNLSTVMTTGKMAAAQIEERTLLQRAREAAKAGMDSWRG